MATANINVASTDHHAVLAKAGYKLDNTTETSSVDRVRTISNYSKDLPVKKGGKNEVMPCNPRINVSVTKDSDSNEVVWSMNSWDKDGNWQDSSGSSSGALGKVVGK
jgi:hypothetical protein